VTHALGLGLTVFTVIFLLELPDKTALAALVLATRHRPLPIFLGAAAAFVIQSAVAVAAGSLLSLLPREPIRIGAGILFLVMATLLVGQNLMRRRAVDDQRELEREERRHRHPFVTAFTVVFVAEWGDLTQLATAALQARYQSGSSSSCPPRSRSGPWPGSRSGWEIASVPGCLSGPSNSLLPA